MKGTAEVAFERLGEGDKIESAPVGDKVLSLRVGGPLGSSSQARSVGTLLGIGLISTKDGSMDTLFGAILGQAMVLGALVGSALLGNALGNVLGNVLGLMLGQNENMTRPEWEQKWGLPGL